MERITTTIPQADIDRQLSFCREIAQINAARPQPPLAFVDTYGCQQNEADSERIRGYLSQMGYGFTDQEEEAQIIVLNTCAIREHAEQRVLGNLGALVHVKRRHPDQIICVCGCMAQEQHRPPRAVEVPGIYPHPAHQPGPHLPDPRRGRLHRRGHPGGAPGQGEGLGVHHVRVQQLLLLLHRPLCPGPGALPEAGGHFEGYKDITLLGQNVNSYGKDLEEPMDFADLLEQVNAVPGDFLIRFMTSHPKDATQKLFETMARCEKVAPVLHLPFQAGNDRVLKVMNRKHTIEQYLDKIRALRALIPDIVLTSDVIVGFPGETTPEFEDTLKVLEEVQFDALFTFIYSPRVGTPAAKMDDPMSREEKLQNFNRLVALQDSISEEKHAAYIGKTMRCLVDGESGDSRYPLSARTPGNRLVRLTGDPAVIGQFVQVKITDANKWSLFGEMA